MARVLWESEKELEDWIYAEAEKTFTNPINGEAVDSIYRQVDLGSYGIADLVTFFYMPHGIEVTIIEVKKETIDVKTFAQLARYRKGFQRYFNDKNYNIEIRMIAVAPEIGRGDDSVWLSDLLTDVTYFYAFTCRFDLNDGVVFHQTNGWTKTSEDFRKLHESIGLSEINRFDSLNRSLDIATDQLKNISAQNITIDLDSEQ